MNSEQKLMSQRNQALWRCLRNLGDAALEAQFRDSCVELSNKTRIKRQFIENINSVHAKRPRQTVLLT